jgi:hypothetical protein
MTCTVGDTNHSGCNYLLVSLYKPDPVVAAHLHDLRLSTDADQVQMG